MEKKYLGVTFTNHAIKRLSQRRIAQSDAWRALKYPDQILKGKSKNSKKFYKNHHQQRIVVIAKQNPQKEWIILSLWSKRMGTGKPIFKPKKLPLETAIEKLVALFFRQHKKI